MYLFKGSDFKRIEKPKWKRLMSSWTGKETFISINYIKILIFKIQDKSNNWFMLICKNKIITWQKINSNKR